tara:strand:+ start:10 stop:2031 length:2022 start_codon:yes stop_codon:yes gene_type:complete
MALTTVTGNMVSVNAIQGTLIADNAITAVHIASNAVTSIQIAENNVTAREIASNSITVAQLADSSVESDKIADGVITTNHLNSAMISSQTEVTAVAGDFVLLGDTSDSNNLKKTPVSSIVALAGVADGAITSAKLDTNIAVAGTLGVTGAITANGNIDVTKTLGWAEMHLDGANGGDLIFKDNGVNYAEIYSGSGHGMVLKSYASQDMYFLTNADATPKMTIKSDGKVGIGTASPSGKLSIQDTTNINTGSNYANKIAPLVIGDVESTGACILIDGNQIESVGNPLYLNNNSSFDTLINVGGGNVGIGTASPTNSTDYNTLDIRGTNGGQIIAGRGAYQDFFMYTTGSAANIGALNNLVLKAGTAGSMTNPGLYLKNDGNVGIGETSPGAKLDVEGDIWSRATTSLVGYFEGSHSANARISIKATGHVQNPSVALGVYGVAATPYVVLQGTAAGYLNTAINPDGGNVGISNTSPEAQLHIKSASNGTVGDAVVIIEADTDNDVEDDNPRLEFWQDGRIVKMRMGYNNNDFEMFNEYAGELKLGTTNTTRMTINSNGLISGDFNDTSDVSLKENIVAIDDGMSVISQMRPVSFDWRDVVTEDEEGNEVTVPSGKGSTKGLIAQEVEAIDEELVVGEEGKKAINTSGVLAYAIKAIQEQQTIIEDLKSRLTAGGL